MYYIPLSAISAFEYKESGHEISCAWVIGSSPYIMEIIHAQRFQGRLVAMTPFVDLTYALNVYASGEGLVKKVRCSRLLGWKC